MKAIALIGTLLAMAGGVRAQDRQVVRPPATIAGLPFSPAVRVGNMLYLSGQLGIVPGTPQLADTGITGQTRQALENVKALLVYSGSSLERVVKCTVFLSDIRDFAAMNAVYTAYFPKDPPARSTVAVSGQAHGWVEGFWLRRYTVTTAAAPATAINNALVRAPDGSRVRMTPASDSGMRRGSPFTNPTRLSALTRAESKITTE